MKITIFDYGAGNLHSLAKAIAAVASEPTIEADPLRALETDVLVLPGVGAFASAAERLASGKDAMRQAVLGGLPCFGICLGMQLFFDASDEGRGAGLGIIPGRVTRLHAERVPQIGWNTVDDAADPLIERSGLAQAYYANGYVCRPTDPGAATAWSTYGGDRFAAMVRVGSALGVQFHPEKSSSPGVALIGAFFDEVRR